MGKYSEKKLCTKNIIIKRNSLQFSSGKPFWTVAPTRPGRYSGLDPFKLSEPAGDGDSTVVVEPELLLCLLQQLPEQRMVEVYYRHQHAVQLAILLPHVYGEMSLGHSRVPVGSYHGTRSQLGVTRPD